MLNALLLLAGLSLIVFLAIRFAGRGAVPGVGTVAPDFRLSDGEGRVHALTDHAGHWLILYFYPRDHTPGCTAEACALRDDFAGFRERGIAVLGVSLDGVARHADFSRRLGLPFPLISDPDGAVARAYGALWNFHWLRFAKRNTFLIDPQGRIARVFTGVSPRRHAAELLTAVDALRATVSRAPPGEGQ